jgi:hypothetical protein
MRNVSGDIPLIRDLLPYRHAMSPRTFSALKRATCFGVLRDYTINDVRRELEKPNGGWVRFARGVGVRSIDELRAALSTEPSVVPDEIEAVCAHCGGTMVDFGYPRKYCSSRCMGLARRTPKVCGSCGVTFYVTRADIAQQFCSRECVPEKAGLPSHPCIKCGADTYGGRIYCSRSCSNSARSNQNTPPSLVERNRSILQDLSFGVTLQDIAKKHGISTARIWQIGKKGGHVYFRKQTPLPQLRDCAICGSVCPKHRSRYCSKACRLKAANECHKRRNKERYHSDPVFRQKVIEYRKQYYEKRKGCRVVMPKRNEAQRVTKTVSKRYHPPKKTHSCVCAVCGEVFEGRKKRYCSPLCSRKAWAEYRREYKAMRYKTDPEYRAKVVESHRQRRARHANP